MNRAHHSAGPGPGDAHLVVLPDHPDAAAAARALRLPGTSVLPHPSGRPWLIGRWAPGELVAAEAGPAALALLGSPPFGRAELARRAARLRDLAELDALARSLPGSSHLIAALDGRIRIQGTASGLRLVFHARVHGCQVAATRADLLAAALGAAPAAERLAVQLLWPVPHPLTEHPMWTEITAVPPDEALIVSPDGRSTRRSRWWTPPEPDRPLDEAAGEVRDRLAEAVRLRTRGQQVVSADLSGGLDSTSVCFLAGRPPDAPRLLAATWPGRDPADTDLHWARKAAARLPDTDHVVWEAESSPLVYTGLLGIGDLLDEPTIGVMDRARALHHLPELAARGSRVHLTGIGGDHVAWCSEAYYHRLLRTRPLFALRRLRGFRALWHWPLGGMVRALADRRPYRTWLADAARSLRDPPAPSVASGLGWSVPPRLFPWVTADAEHLARQALLSAAETASPLHPDRGMHADLEQIRACGRIIRQWEAMAARAGLPMASPFLDDRVIETCLAVRPCERVTPWAYKPLLTTAMRGVVPDECLRRANKAEASLDAADGLRRHRGELAELWTDSRLAGLGLVDAAALRRLAQRPSAPGLREAILYSTIACEVWLRSRPRTPSPGPPPAVRKGTP
ncbi:lasso peptide isopeptide bond-forming cyclase [Streptomyces sp. YIM 98790]|uniref:lasso peptide isopeptide bond-forming cyclase n=1 Tax=Streptomyces sp. YIM 98790 TaxID=2689077 RepID=UPI001407FD92|nr:lasso peptide isopeptide bond-forming cyclase [Streptomyces sp. YIM 98790]